MSIPTTATLAEIRRRIQQSAAARRHPDIASALDDEQRAEGPSTTVVIVGEKKRGKSSLVNALLRRPGLLPVDVDIATSCYIAVTYGAEPQATAFADEAPDGIAIAMEDIGRWASVDGNRIPGTSPPEPRHPGVTAVVVEVPEPLLASGLTVIDTPGVGGLEAGHTDITLAVLPQADALIFVVDPDSGFRSSELAFLAKATGRIARVAFALTKIDRYPSWREVLDENRTRLAANAADWAASPWFELSSLIAYDAADAAEAGDDDAEDLWRESGFAALAGYLSTDVAARGVEIRAENQAHELRRAIRSLEDAERRMLAAADGDPEVRDELARQQGTLAALLADDATWPTELSKAFDGVRASLQRDFRTRLRAARADLQDRVAGEAIALAALPTEVDLTLRAVWIEVMAAMEQQLSAVVAMLAGSLANEGTDVLSEQVPYPDGLAALPELRAVGDADKDFGDAVDEYMPVVLATGGAYTVLVGVLSLVNPITAIAVGLGAGLARKNAQQAKRVRARDRATGTAYVTRTLEQAADDMGSDLQRILTDTRARVEQTVRELMVNRRTELEDQVRELRKRVRADEAALAVARRQTETALHELAELREAIDQEALEASAGRAVELGSAR